MFLSIKEKQERNKKFKSLREKEDVLCKRLALPPHDTSIGEIPTPNQVKEIEANINYMESELVFLCGATVRVEGLVSVRKGFFNRL